MIKRLNKKGPNRQKTKKKKNLEEITLLVQQTYLGLYMLDYFHYAELHHKYSI